MRSSFLNLKTPKILKILRAIKVNVATFEIDFEWEKIFKKFLHVMKGF
jgi:hypothetical protein